MKASASPSETFDFNIFDSAEDDVVATVEITRRFATKPEALEWIRTYCEPRDPKLGPQLVPFKRP